jgi:hypothetical protein
VRGVLVFSALMSPRLVLLIEEPGAGVREDRTKSPLVSLRRSGCMEACLLLNPPGLELGSYLIGEDSTRRISSIPKSP